MGGFRAAGLAAAAVTAVGVVGLAAPAYADSTVVVQGTSFPDPARASLSFVGCDDLYQRSDEELAPSVGPGPGLPPSGTRSLGWDLTGGNAVGVVFPVPSVLATTTASLEVNADGRASGVAYAGYQQPSDAGTPLIWIGRAGVVTPGSAWQDVDAAGRVYTWTKYDMLNRHALGQVLGPGQDASATIADFAATHGGDGPGFFSIGFGCDGTPFSMDTLRVGGDAGVTTYDLEGLRTSVTISSGRPSSRGEVTITGQLRTETGEPIPLATMILERRVAGSQDWEPVEVAPVQDGVAHALVSSDVRAAYRWRFVERPLAEGSVSPAVTLEVLLPPPTGSPTPTQPPSPTASATDTPSPTATSEPPAPATSSAPAEPPSDPVSPTDTSSSAAASVSASPSDPVDESPTPSTP